MVSVDNIQKLIGEYTKSVKWNYRGWQNLLKPRDKPITQNDWNNGLVNIIKKELFELESTRIGSKACVILSPEAFMIIEDSDELYISYEDGLKSDESGNVSELGYIEVNSLIHNRKNPVYLYKYISNFCLVCYEDDIMINKDIKKPVSTIISIFGI
jgi:hypothetical protein